jgi:hypothetical protein
MYITQPSVFYSGVSPASPGELPYRSRVRGYDGSHDIKREHASIENGSARHWDGLRGQVAFL